MSNEVLVNNFKEMIVRGELITAQRKVEGLDKQVERLQKYIIDLHTRYDYEKTDSWNDVIEVCDCGGVKANILNFSTRLLKEVWDRMYEDGYEYLENIIDEVHLELNMRGEGEYCAV